MLAPGAKVSCYNIPIAAVISTLCCFINRFCCVFVFINYLYVLVFSIVDEGGLPPRQDRPPLYAKAEIIKVDLADNQQLTLKTNSSLSESSELGFFADGF